MPQNFLACDREQVLLLPPDLREWLPDDHLAWFVLDVVAALDLASFYASYRVDGHGRAAHDPAMMLALLVYAYAIGERSARGIERRCRDDVAFRVIAANQIPDHATIARFRVRHEDALAELFGQVLRLCADAGMVRVGVVAVDGTKLAAMASDRANRTYEEIAAEIIEQAGRIDAAEDERYGEARGDELPPELATGEGRRAWLRDAQRRLEEERVGAPEPVPHDRAERLDLCRERLVEDWQSERRAHRDYEAWRARGMSRDGARRMGRPTIAHPLPEQPAGRINVTDPDSRNMKGPRGYVQGYNAQVVATEQQVIIAAEIAPTGLDFAELAPMMCAADEELHAAGVEEPIGVVVADAGYWSNHQIDAVRAQGIAPLVAPDAHKRDGPRRGRVGGPYDFMRRVLATDTGAELYSRRQWIVEPIF